MNQPRAVEQPQLLRKLLTHSVFNSGCYMAAQGINFLFQLWLLHALGKEIFGHIGIAQMCVAALIFIGEFGMPSYFIRVVHQGTAWAKLWRRACWFRMGVAGFGVAGLLLFWRLYYGAAPEGLGFLIMAIPGVVCAVWNPSPILIGQNKNRIAAMGLMVLWVVCALSSLMALHYVPEDMQQWWLGGCLSLGYIAQFMFLTFHVTPDIQKPGDHTPLLGHMLRQSFVIWLPGLVGTLYSLSLTFMVQATHVSILHYVVLGTQIMQGISGVNMQIQRLLLPAFLTERKSGAPATAQYPIFALFTIFVVASTGGVLGLLFAAEFLKFEPAIVAGTLYLCLMVVERTISHTGTFLVTLLISQHRENYIFRVTMIGFSVSFALQALLLVATDSLLAVMVIRVLASILLLVALHHAVKLPFSRLVMVAAAAMTLLGFWQGDTPEHYLTLTLMVATSSVALLYYWVRRYRHFTRSVGSGG